MKYENAKDLLPEELLIQLQNYAAGKLLYVPIHNESKNWGEASGYRQKLTKRNLMICNKYSNGSTVSELADEYYLSLDSIKKILYSKKNKTLSFSNTLSSAIAYANAGLAEEWIQSFFMFSMDHNGETEYLPNDFITFGVAKLPLRLIQQDYEKASYQRLLKTYGHTLKETEPLVIRYDSYRFYVDFQKELLQALKNRRVNAYPVFIIITDKDEYKIFMRNYGNHLIMVDKLD